MLRNYTTHPLASYKSTDEGYRHLKCCLSGKRGKVDNTHNLSMF